MAETVDAEIFKDARLPNFADNSEEQSDDAYDPEAFLKLADICPRGHCSRCTGQMISEEWLRDRGRVLRTVTVERAAELCALYTEGIIKMQQFLTKAKQPLIDNIRCLPVRTSVEILERTFEDLGHEQLSNAVDEFGWHNVYADQLKAKKGVSYLFENRERLLRRRDALESRIVFAADAPPTSQLHEAAVCIEPAWREGLFALTSSRCFVDLTPVRFGKVIEPYSTGLHQEGIYTFLKGHILLQKLYWWLRTLCNFNNGIRQRMREFEEKCRQVVSNGISISTVPYVGMPGRYYRIRQQKLHEYLQEGAETIASARAVLEKTITATMLYGECLALDHDTASRWKNYGTRAFSTGMKKLQAFYEMTAGRLTLLMLMHALERDINRYRISAVRRAQGQGTKTALLQDWESLQSGIMACLHYFGRALLWATQFEGEHKPLNDNGSYDAWEIEERVMVFPEHHLGWVLSRLSDPRFVPAQKITSMLAFLEFKKIAAKVFPQDLQFILIALKGIQTVLTAMESLQPFGLREFDIKWQSWPGYGGEAIQVMKYWHTAHVDNLKSLMERVWNKFELHKAGQIESKYREVWSAVFEWLTKEWREHGISENMLQKMAELRKKVKNLSNPKKSAPKSPPAPSVSLSLPSVSESGVVERLTTVSEDLDDEEVSGSPREPSPVSARAGRVTRQAKPQPASRRPPQDPPEIPLFEFGSLQVPPKPSKFKEELTWEEQQQRRGFNLLRSKEPTSTANTSLEDEGSSIPSATGALPVAFTNPKSYENWRCIFPLRTEGEKGGRLRWEPFVSLLQSSPLNFDVADDVRSILKFHRQAHDGWPVGVVTVHKPHGLNPWLEKHDSDLLRKDFRRAFGWEEEDFVLVDKAGGQDGSGPGEDV